MRAYELVLCIGALLPSCVAPAANETVIAPHNLGLVDITCADGAGLSLEACTMGPGWASADSRHATLVKGLGADLLKAGQTTLLPVRNTGGKLVEVFAQLQPDAKDPAALRFTYRFTAREATPINSAFAVLKLPVKPYAGQALEVTDGKALAPVMSVVPPPREGTFHLANGTAKGVAIAPDKPCGFRITLDTPSWCCVNDERYWNPRNDFYTVQLCAVVAAEGTTLREGQSAEVRGTIRFSAPIRVAEPTPVAAAPAPLVGQTLRAELGNPCAPRLCDTTGGRVLTVGLFQAGLKGGSTSPEEPMEADTPTTLGAVAVKARLWSDADRKAGFELRQEQLAKPGELSGVLHLAATHDFRTLGVVQRVWLAAKYVEGSTATFVGNRSGEALAVTLRPGEPMVIGRAIATGVRIGSGGQRVFEVTGDATRCWEIWGCDDGYVIAQRVIDDGLDPVTVAKGDECEAKLTIRWGGE